MLFIGYRSSTGKLEDCQFLFKNSYGSNWGDNSLSYPMYRDFKANNSVFSGMFCRFGDQFSLGFNGTTELANGELVSGTYFPVLGVAAAIGRTFTPDDDRIPGGHPLAMLSYAN